MFQQFNCWNIRDGFNCWNSRDGFNRWNINGFD